MAFEKVIMSFLILPGTIIGRKWRNFLIELTGKFPSQSHRPPKKRALEPTPENCEAFRKYLTKLWADLPDALPTKQAADLIGICPQRLQDLVKKGNLHGVTVGAVQVIVKEELIAHVTSPEMVVKIGSGENKRLIDSCIEQAKQK